MAEASHRERDDNGFLTVRGTPISSYGIFEYSAAQVGLRDGDPNRIVNVFRPESSITDPEAIESFQVVPFIDEHNVLSGFEDDETAMAPEDKGVDGVMLNVAYNKPWLTADVKVFTRRMQRAIDSGKVELSLGYSCDFVLKPGNFEGQKYEVIQVNLRGNHLALVDTARVEGARVLDSKIIFDCLSFNVVNSSEEQTMSTRRTQGKYAPRITRKATMDSAVAELQKLLPQLSTELGQFFKEEGQEPEHQEGDAGPEGSQVAEPAADPEGGQVAEPEGGQVAEPAADPEGGQVADPEGSQLGSLIDQVKKILAELESSISAEGGPAAVAGDEQQDEGVPPALDDEGVNLKAGDCEINGRTSPGPAKGKNSGSNVGDAAIRKSVYADMAQKQRLYDRVSPVIGAFDHALMTAEDMAAYAAKKLNINAPKGMATFALDSYLAGAERASAARKTKQVGDSAFGTCDPIEKYLQEAR